VDWALYLLHPFEPDFERTDSNHRLFSVEVTDFRTHCAVAEVFLGISLTVYDVDSFLFAHKLARLALAWGVNSDFNAVHLVLLLELAVMTHPLIVGRRKERKFTIATAARRNNSISEV
jgi:hypothetical protein